jgi:hypothetical protein
VKRREKKRKGMDHRWVVQRPKGWMSRIATCDLSSLEGFEGLEGRGSRVEGRGLKVSQVEG